MTFIASVVRVSGRTAALAVSFGLLSAPVLSLADEAPAPVDMVDPFVGTAGDHGQLTPAATGPFGMVQLSPDTVPAQHAGYDYDGNQLAGFSHTRAVGVGCGGGGGDLLVSVGYAGEAGPWAMDKASERAGPGWYGVSYGGGVRAELAAVGAEGLSRFTMPRAGTVRVILDPRHSYTKRRSARWERRKPDDLRGSMSAGTVCDQGVYHLSFASTLRRNGEAVTSVAIPLGNDRLAFDLPVTAGDRIELRTGLSVVDTRSARKVLQAGVARLSLEQVKERARQAWAQELGRVQVPGSGERARLFYTHLFRVLQTPARIDDVNGRYRRSDGTLHHVPRGHHRYAGWAVWDNYRTQLPLIALLDRDRSADVAASLAELYIAGKAQWATQHEPFITVRTEHAGVALLDFRRKGIGGFDAAEVLPLMVKELDALPNTAPDQQIETAYDVWAAAELAHDLGDEPLATRLRERSLRYRTTWKREFETIAPDFDIVKARGLYQGTLWQYRWAPVFDLDWLIDEQLGRTRFNRELDRFFDEGLFNMTNQPDIQAPFLFALSGQPQKTATLIDGILNRPIDHWYTNAGKRPAPWHGRSFALSPGGYADGMDDDAGGMAAWYVWASLGLYPITPGKPEYVITTPAFTNAVIHPQGGGRITIERLSNDGPSFAARWNGIPLPAMNMDHRSIVAGGRLEVFSK
ncbi:glycoside hydrolase domain-containing protein [Novosphingobium resinovorum]|uniref:glycoside hydrolase domain-containing protein n=1 Tax=Novosphingobium resinovorum TaxID=158500 RepID=UPI002ED0C36C|nr:glycoside hydrolase domain-containing protein [Novosphingobium resinovorum]